jgi:hypothetical protein
MEFRAVRVSRDPNACGHKLAFHGSLVAPPGDMAHAEKFYESWSRRGRVGVASGSRRGRVGVVRVALG